MAIMIPHVPNDFTPESREGDMFFSLQKLPDDYYVFHSFRIINIIDSEWKENEIDFVIFNRNKGIICLEAKAGHIHKYYNKLFKHKEYPSDLDEYGLDELINYIDEYFKTL